MFLGIFKNSLVLPRGTWTIRNEKVNLGYMKS